MYLLQVFMDFCWFLFFQCIQTPLIWIRLFFSGTHTLFYSDGRYRMMLQLVWICKQHDVFQFEYWLYFNVFSRIKNTHSHLNTIVLCKIGNYRGINLYVTFITVSLTKKKHTHRMLKTQMVLQKAQSIKIVCICVGYRRVSVEISCIIIENTIVHPLFRSRNTIVERLELFLEFLHKKVISLFIWLQLLKMQELMIFD